MYFDPTLDVKIEHSDRQLIVRATKVPTSPEGHSFGHVYDVHYVSDYDEAVAATGLQYDPAVRLIKALMGTSVIEIRKVLKFVDLLNLVNGEKA